MIKLDMTFISQSCLKGLQMLDLNHLLEELQQNTKNRFKQEKTILSFQEYLALFIENPKPQIRDTALYLKDVFDHFGTQIIQKPYGTLKRFRLFDAKFDSSIEPLIGQELVQNQLYGLIQDFIQEGKINKLILLHGPNGSAKSTTIQCLMSAMEHYSHLEEGALYRFNWVFPSKKKQVGHGAIGFGSKLDGQLTSFAHLPEQEIDVLIKSEMKDHPLLLLPKTSRVALIKSLMGENFVIPRALEQGDLSPKFAQIYESLLHANQGDLNEVLKYVQVERFYVSRLYRSASSTIDPQLRADASIRQVTADRSLSALPASLQNLNLFEPMGPLVEANRGILEYNDLLKRPIESFKYLLSLCETGIVHLDQMNLAIDTLLIASSNEEYLQAFKEVPDFASFKGRIELIPVPYLLDAHLESQIYQTQIKQLEKQKHVHPRVVAHLGKWAVLSRLEKPISSQYEDGDQTLIKKLMPMDKLFLYQEGKTFFDFNTEEQSRLKQLTEFLYQESKQLDFYEGISGASARELKGVLLQLARNQAKGKCIHSLHLFEALRQLSQQSSIYAFLKRPRNDDYHDVFLSIQQLRQQELNTAELEILGCLSLIDQGAALSLFKRYIDLIKAHLQQEKIFNPLNQQHEAVSENMMRDIEQLIGISAQDAQKKRSDYIQRIAKWKLENQNLDLSENYGVIFQAELKEIQSAYFKEKKSEGYAHFQGILQFLHQKSDLNEEQIEKYAKMIQKIEKIGYCSTCLTDILNELIKIRLA